MARVQPLDLVRQDLATGRTSSAIRRLRAVLAADPAEGQAYRLLTEIYRAAGNAEEAGRWGYLTGDATADEVAAFESAHPWSWSRLRLLGDAIEPEQMPSELARERLAQLRAAADAELEASLPEDPPPADPVRRPTQAWAGPTVALTPLTPPPTTPEPPFPGPVPSWPVTGPPPPAPSGPPTAPPAAAPLAPPAAAPLAPPAAAPLAPPAAAAPWKTPGTPPGAAPSWGAQPYPEEPPDHPSSEPSSSAYGPQARHWRVTEPLRRLLFLAMVILMGTLGSLIAVGGIRAALGAPNWLSSLWSLIRSIGR